ncbi:MAG: DNA-protecting protein DprA [Magnetococcales bacterium]|nr:DNA-protecting protein DprA [Magnetococcales bacterium]
MRKKSVADWLRFIKIPGLGPVGIDKLLQHFGQPEAILTAKKSNLAEVAGISPTMVASLTSFRESIAEEPIIHQLKQLHNIGGEVIILGTPEYPHLLREIHDPPPVLFALGDTTLLNSSNTIAVVGSRRASRSGLGFAHTLGSDLAKNGIITVSGLALGIDSAAHRGALVGGGPTVAVVATGLDVDYPPQNRELKKQIRENGCIITEAPLGTQAAPYLFPPRNRIISGISRGVAVVEASLRSGSLITARMALEQNREVFAVPGSGAGGDSRAKGVNDLIRQGACVLENVDNIIQEIQFSSPTTTAKAQNYGGEETRANIKISEARLKNSSIIDHLADGPLLADELARKCQLTVASLSRILLHLELTGVVVRLAGNRYALLNN